MFKTIEQALDYWNAHRDMADYRINFTLRPDADRADITIQFVETIERCGGVDTDGPILGCAPYLDGVRRVPGPITVRIVTSGGQETAYNTIRHEFGHVLGIGHGEPPMPLMAENNLFSKAAPWNRSALRVYVDHSDKPGITTAKSEEQINATLSYFEVGAEGTVDPTPVYRRVTSRSDANVVILLHGKENPETDEPGSEVETVSGDVDGTLYKRVVISLWGIDTDAVGWHIGYWLVYSFERPMTETEIPSPFVNASYHERRSEWWH